MPSKKRPPTQTDNLLKIADTLYEICVDETRQDVVAVPRSGPRIAVRLKGRSGLSGHLLREYHRRHGGVPSANAITSALALLEAMATDAPRVKTYLRSARIADDALVVDLASPDGFVVIERGKWRVSKSAPEDVTFRRTATTMPMPRPQRRGKLTPLRDLFALDREAWDLVRAWLVLALIEDIPVPILGLLGPNGAGKSYLARALVRIVDPAPAPLRRLPRKAEDWPVMLNASRVIGLDNVSRLSLDVSDDISRAVTGEGDEKRQLYTDEDSVIFNYRRAFVLTSIDPGAMRGDFADRLMAVLFDRMSEDRRRGEREMNTEIDRLMPALLGGLLSSLAKVLANPRRLDLPPRMADAAHVMAALDALAGSDSVGAYRRSLATSVERVLEGDPVSETVAEFMEGRERWEGTPTQLYVAITDSDVILPDHNWPANAQKLSERLTRLVPALKEGKGLVVDRRRDDKRVIVMSWNGRMR